MKRRFSPSELRALSEMRAHLATGAPWVRVSNVTDTDRVHWIVAEGLRERGIVKQVTWNANICCNVIHRMHFNDISPLELLAACGE